MISDFLELVLFDAKILVSLAVSIPLGFAVGSYLGFVTGLATFGASFVAVLFGLIVRAWSKRR